MDKEFWLTRWHKGEIGFHQDTVNTHLQNFWNRIPLAADARVFVPLCGKSRDMLWLRAQGHSILGVEISPLAINDFFTENKLAVNQSRQNGHVIWRADGIDIIEGDFFNLGPEQLHGVAGVYDRASLIALPPPLRSRYATHMKDILPPGCKILLITMEYDHSEMDGPPFSVTRDEVRSLYQSGFTVDHVYREDILEINPRFKQRGLTRLEENVYLLNPRED
jgi:thiopurine S-methyltransferase